MRAGFRPVIGDTIAAGGTMLTLLAAHPIANLLGTMHPVLVHFPIALLVVAAIVEVIHYLKHRAGPSTVALTMAWIGFAGCVAAVASGLTLGWGDDSHDVYEHRLAGLVTIGIAACMDIAIIIAHRRVQNRRSWMAYRVLLLGAAAGVGYTGHLGGEITHGEGYLTNALRAVVGLAPEREHDEDRARERPRPTPAGPIGVTAPDAPRVDFAAQIEPILLKECVSCHGPKKQKGQLRCDSLAAIVRGGKHGPAITPGDAKNSLLLIRIRGDDGDDTMPKDADPLTPTQVQLITDWINQGAKAP